MSAKDLPVCINVVATMDCIEIVRLDEGNNIQTAASLPFAINPVSREIQNMEGFQETIKNLYEANDISFKTPAVLVLPSFMTREFEIPAERTDGGVNLMLSKEELNFALISEAERFHIFKTKGIEPEVAHTPMDEVNVIYTAYPKPEIEKIYEVFGNLRISLLRIDINYLAILRGLLPTGYISEQVEGNQPWCLVVVNNNALFMALMEGANFRKTTEAPLAIDPGDVDGPLSEIQNDFDGFVTMEDYTKVVVVNNSPHTQAAAIGQRLGVTVPVETVDQNSGTLRSRGASDGFPCSLEALGGALSRQFKDLPSVNLKPKGSADIGEIDALRDKMFKVLLGVNVAVFIFVLLMWGVLHFIVLKGKEAEIQALSKQASDIALDADAGQYIDIQRRLYTKKLADVNKSINDLLVHLGVSVTNDAWLDKVAVTTPEANNGFSVTMEVDGRSRERQSVDQIVSQLKQAANRQDFSVKGITPENSDDGQQHYKWTIHTEQQGQGAAGSANFPGRR